MTDAPEAVIDDPYEGRYTSAELTVNGLRLHHTDWGAGAPGCPNVLLVHGLNAQLHTWDPIAAALTDEFHVRALDLRGHGDSEWAPDGYAIASFVGDLAEYLAAVGVARTHVVGHSLGARIAIAFAAEHPQLVDRLVLSDAGPEIATGGATVVQNNPRNSSKRGFRSEAEALADFRELYPAWEESFYHLHVKYQLRRNWVGKLVWKSDPELFWLSGSAGRRESPYLWSAAGRVAAPTLILRGEHSYLLDAEITERMLATMPNAVEQTFDTGHYIPREAPTEFVAAVRRFLTAADAVEATAAGGVR